MGPILLYGATGYTGRLVAGELDARGADFVVAGRDRAKLEALAARLATRPRVAVAASDDAAALDEAVRGAASVVSCAGPFVRVGRAILDAALRARVPYGDIAGEPDWLAHVERAAAASPAVPALGFDVVPSDLACHAAARGLADVERIDLGFATRGRPSRGTRRSMALSAGGGWLARVDGRLVSAAPGRWTRAFDFPPPFGRSGAAFVPWGDVATAQRTTGARTVRTFFAHPRARWMRAASPFLPLFRRSIGRRLAERAERAREGPSEEERTRALFAIVAEARSSDGTTARAVVTGRDPYGLTGATAAAGAILLAEGKARAGFASPMEAFGPEPFLAAGKPFDLRVET